MITRLKILFTAGLNLMLGVGLGWLGLEVTLQLNPQLLVRGIAAPAPLDWPLTTRDYEVHYSDADEIFWRPDLIRPIQPEADRLEAQVHFATDEMGFRNRAPLPAQVNAVVLGRSISLGAQTAHPWPERLASQMSWVVLNLAQPGGGLDDKTAYLRRFGLARQPQWVIVEVQPSIDIFGYGSNSAWVTPQLPTPILQWILRPWLGEALVFNASEPIYPLIINLPNRTLPLTCCLHYLETLTVDQATLQLSQDWEAYRQQMRVLIQAAQAQGACVALLYAPMKPDIYFPLATEPSQLEPTLGGLLPLRLAADNRLQPDPTATATIHELQRNAFAGRDTVAAWAKEAGLVFIDPAPTLIETVLSGADPFMVYDSHWNAIGHEVVAQAVTDALSQAPCP